MMSIRLHFIVEGQTEETFVTKILAPHLAGRSIWADARCVQTSRRGGRKYRGGISHYAQVRKDIRNWTREDQNSDARFTTMFDLYALPQDFPCYDAATQRADPLQRADDLEDALAQDICDDRFIPYIQVHEFEALLLAAPAEMDSQFPDDTDAIRRLGEMASRYQSPEHIDDGRDTAPSKRIIREIPAYEGRKASAGPLVAGRIGLNTLRTQCLHFGAWIDRLEALA